MVAESTLILVFRNFSALFHPFLDFIHCLILFLPTALVQVHVQVVGDWVFPNLFELLITPVDQSSFEFSRGICINPS
jgi:hypothetical protein